MRPRHKAAEIRPRSVSANLPIELASMRPRHKAAEIIAAVSPSRVSISGFNEAAA